MPLNPVGFGYSRPSDNLAASLTPTLVAGTADSSYPVTNLTDGNPALPFKTTTSNLTLQWDLGSAISLGFLTLIHTNLNASTCQWQFNTQSDFLGTGESTLISLPSQALDGYRDNPWSDRFGATARRFVRLVISGNSAPIVIGELWFSNVLRQLAHPHGRGLTRVERRRSYLHETVGGVRIGYDAGVRESVLSNTKIVTTRAVGLADILTWHRDARGRARTFPLVLDTTVNHAMLMNFDTDQIAATSLAPGWVSVDLALREAGRGLAV